MSVESVEYGRIDEVFFGIEDHGILGFSIGVDFGAVHRGTGVYSMDGEHAGKFIRAVLVALGARNLDELIGKVVSVRSSTYITALTQAPWDGKGSIDFNEFWKEAAHDATV